MATYVMETSTKTAIEIQELASGRRAAKCTGLKRRLAMITAVWEWKYLLWIDCSKNASSDATGALRQCKSCEAEEQQPGVG